MGMMESLAAAPEWAPWREPVLHQKPGTRRALCDRGPTCPAVGTAARLALVGTAGLEPARLESQAILSR